VIEGFYGPPWSHAERLNLLAFCGEHGFNAWVHAPKDDPYHRAQWRDPYADEEVAQLGELVAEADRHGVEFVYAIGPGLSICYSRDDDFAALIAKCEQVRSAGVRSFQLLWDDVEHTLNCAEDEARYGHEERPSAAAQSELSNRFAAEFAQPGPLVICPMGYAGCGDSPYRKIMRRDLSPDVVVYWTGPEVVSWAIAREELDVAVDRFGGRTLMLWDNYPVNDFDGDRLFLGPLRGRDPRLSDGHLAGIIANGMVQAVPSKLALATVADWAREPAAYEPAASYERALRAHAAEVVESLRAIAHGRVDIARPTDVPALVDVLALGVDAATGAALLEPFVA